MSSSDLNERIYIFLSVDEMSPGRDEISHFAFSIVFLNDQPIFKRVWLARTIWPCMASAVDCQHGAGRATAPLGRWTANTVLVEPTRRSALRRPFPPVELVNVR